VVSCFEGNTILHCSNTGIVVSNSVQRTDVRTLSFTCALSCGYRTCNMPESGQQSNQLSKIFPNQRNKKQSIRDSLVVVVVVVFVVVVVVVAAVVVVIVAKP